MDNKIFSTLKEIFKDLGPGALSLNHYDLADKTTVNNPELWKEFLLTPEIAAWIRTEFDLIRESELRKMTDGISASHSVGKAQLMNTLAKLNEGKNLKEGPVFIYCYIPLSEEQKKAPNVKILDFDPFVKK